MDIRLHYIEKGSGETLILLHGNGESSAYFIHQMAYFSKKYRVIAVDTRGHGWSPRGIKPFTIEQFAEDLKDFMDQKSIEKAHLLGFSDGGNIALTFALKYPEKVQSLVLNGANLNPYGVKSSVQRPIVWEYRLVSRFSSKSIRALKRRELLGLMVEEPNIDPKALENLKIKTLVIAGTRDMIKEEHTQLIYQSLPMARLAFVEGDHFIANKCPKIFNETVEDFLKVI